MEPWERKKRREDKAVEKELKKQKAKAREATRKLQEQANSTDTGKKEKKNVKRSKSNEDDGDIDNNAKDPEAPYGEKKLLSLQMDKEHNPSAVQKGWYDWYQWWEQGFSMADAKSSKPPFVKVPPPPNVTGVLHIGHALITSIEDTIIHWRRMSGSNTLPPGRPGPDMRLESRLSQAQKLRSRLSQAQKLRRPR